MNRATKVVLGTTAALTSSIGIRANAEPLPPSIYTQVTGTLAPTTIAPKDTITPVKRELDTSIMHDYTPLYLGLGLAAVLAVNLSIASIPNLGAKRPN